MSVLRTTFSGIKRGWEDLASRYRIRRLPPGPTLIVVLAAGLLIPQAVGMNRTPAELTPSLAQERLDRYAERHGDVAPAFGPTGPILSDRPAFFWPAVPDAVKYRFRLPLSDGTVWVGAEIAAPTTHHQLPSPGKLEPGSYRFEVEAIGPDGAILGTRTGAFTVAAPTEELKKLRKLARYELAPAEGALVLMGYYAAKESHHDVAGAALLYRATRDGATPALADPAGAWFEARFGG